ncbi:hypothetical protein BJX76DRAFT_366515 [Aspergillus varians]
MSQPGESPRQSPVTENQINTNGEGAGSGARDCDNYQKANTGKVSPQDIDVSPRTGAHIDPETHSLSREREDSMVSRIPRATGSKVSPGSSAVKGPKSASSIPVAIYRRSTEHLGVSSQERQTEPSPSGIRLAEKPRGPRPPPLTEKTPLLIPESGQGTEEVAESSPVSTSPPSAKTWEFQDISEFERPPTVFTGEYRTRILTMPGNRTPGPTLRIASSAEDIIMGGSSRGQSNNAITQRASPSLIQRLGKFTPSTPRDTNSPRDTTPGSKGTPGLKAGARNTPVSRILIRPHASLDSIPRSDFSGKELSIPRKPVNRPSVSSLFSPSLTSLQVDQKPMVPKIPDQYLSGQENTLHQISSRTLEPETPAKVASGPKDSPSNPISDVTPMPKTVIKAGKLHPGPPRSSSLQVISDSSENSHLEKSHPGVRSRVATNLKRNVTFSDIEPLTLDIENSGQGPERSKLPESKSNQLLGSFRNIFRSRGGAADRERVKKEEGDASMSAKENNAPSREKVTAKETPLHNDSEKVHKPKTKYTRLSSGVSWNRSSRSESPTTPTPAVPRLLAPPDRVPSFAQPTTSTRTKAASTTKENSSIPPGVQARRSHVRTASSGSPQRLARRPRCATGNTAMTSAQNKSNRSPDSVSRNTSASKKTAPTSDMSTNSIPTNLDKYRNYLETLCKKVVEAPTALEREGLLGLALRLQQELVNYQNIEKIALEVESLAKERHLAREVAEESLDTSLAEIQAQLEQD